MRKRWIVGILLVAIAAVGVGYYAWASSQDPKDITFTLGEGLGRLEVADAVGEAMRWNAKEKENFAVTHAQIQWAAWNGDIIPVVVEKYGWTEAEREAFATQSALYFKEEYDFLSGVYAPGSYTVKNDMSAAQIADLLVTRAKEGAGGDFRAYLAEHLAKEPMEKVAMRVRKETELLPDIVPVPARDLDVIREDGKIYLRFTTIYYNQGKGPLELVPDPALLEIRGQDIERTVFQRIYRPDGSFRDKTVGVFFWHQPHLHYHFKDFVVYDLEPVDVPGAPNLEGVLTKSTFCVRDVSRVDLELAYRDEKARYLICGRNLQGISVGWADTYFFDYPDQRLNITDLPSGTYTLTFKANPDNAFDELDTENNVASVTFRLDMSQLKAEKISEEPKNPPKIQHVYIEQVFNN